MWVRAFTGIHSESQMPQLPNEQMSKDSNSQWCTEVSVYGADIMTRVIAQVQPVHTMNAEQCQMAADLWTKPTDLSRTPACRLLETTVIDNDIPQTVTPVDSSNHKPYNVHINKIWREKGSSAWNMHLTELSNDAGKRFQETRQIHQLVIIHISTRPDNHITS